MHAPAVRAPSSDLCGVGMRDACENAISSPSDTPPQSRYRTTAVQVQFDDRTGRSTGSAEVVFAKQSDAVKAVDKFNTRTLDGVPMQVGARCAVGGCHQLVAFGPLSYSFYRHRHPHR